MGIKERWKRFNELPENYRKRLLDLIPFFEKEEVLLVYLFGSGRKHKGEDLDVAVLTDEEDLSKIRRKLYESMGSQRIDLVNLRRASNLICFQIIQEGDLIYKKMMK